MDAANDTAPRSPPAAAAAAVATGGAAGVVARNPSAFRIKKMQPASALAIDTEAIPAVPLEQQTAELRNLSTVLGVNVFNSTELERNVIAQVESAIGREEQAADSSRLRRVQQQIKQTRDRLRQARDDLVSAPTEALRASIQELTYQLRELRSQEDFVQKQLRRHGSGSDGDAALGAAGAAGAAGSETERERMIRLGQLTPFDRVEGKERRVQPAPSAPLAPSTPARPAPAPPAPVLRSPRPPQPPRRPAAKKPPRKSASKSKGTAPEREASPDTDVRCVCGATSEPDAAVFMIECQTCGKWQHGACVGVEEQSVPASYTCYACKDAVSSQRKRPRSASSDVAVEDGEIVDGDNDDDDDNDMLNDELSSSGDDDDDERLVTDGNMTRRVTRTSDKHLDDVSSTSYEDRALAWAQEHYRHRVALRDRVRPRDVEPPANLSWRAEEVEPCADDVTFEGGFRLPLSTYDALLGYQRTGVRWLWELHCQNAGGIIGDEMGLGKTVQTIAFLGGLRCSGLSTAPTLVVCPATLLRQWRREFHHWWPPACIGIIHKQSMAGSSTAAQTLRVIQRQGGVVVTTYESLKLHRTKLLEIEWSYVVLDEGHKIKNPDAAVTLAAKQLRTSHRLILSGSPIQNKLTELWSLFDFVFPGRLGTLPVFQSQFEIPIQIGGYANASVTQVQTAFRCACVLRDLISPYLLRRVKADVAQDLPKKSEQVLFSRLTPEQRAVYRKFLRSDAVNQILEGRRHALYGIDILRKICNHPDLLERETASTDDDYGNPERSGKLKVVEALLPMWHAEGHRALLFCQTRQMLDILERAIKRLGVRFLRMDGMTAIGSRLRLIDEFNRNEDVFAFLLTTRVGGLGVNLTGADRVLIFDPDWNPSTDIQARERAWRYGQKRDVTVYRLMTAGTIEEKIYHRQIFKQFLTNKILKDPKQRRFFKSNDMKELFTLDEEGSTTETGDLFAGIDVETTRREHDAAAHDDPAVATNGAGNNGAGGDDHILRGLFSKAGVHSSLNHDAIVGASGPEHALVNREAERIAAEAAAALKQSRQHRARFAVNVPTWTGRSGAAGSPGAKPRFGGRTNPRLAQLAESRGGSSSNGGSGGSDDVDERAQQPSQRSRSQSLLHDLHERGLTVEAVERDDDNDDDNDDAADADQPASAPVLPASDERTALIARLVEFLSLRRNKATSEQIVAEFGAEVKGDLVPVFRAMLRQVALHEVTARGTGWRLRPEFE